MSDSPERLDLQWRLRSAPQYELVAFDRLRSTEQAYLYHWGKNPDMYGILRPRDGRGVHVQAVGKLVASLFTALGQPGPVPHFASAAWGPHTRDKVTQLVLDGVLEIEDHGAFVSGIDAHPILMSSGVSHSSVRRLDALSRRALQYVESLRLCEPAHVSQRLYRYNTQPASPRWRRRFPDDHAVSEFLDLDHQAMNEELVNADATSRNRRDASTTWIQWDSTASATGHRQPRYKLYLSPSIESVRDAFYAVIAEFGNGKMLSFKIGRGLSGLLRPDKLVMYFAEFEDVEWSAERLGHNLQHVRAQGVPFTAGLDERGLCSWGMDPPRDQQLLGWSGGESWRLWITNRLATAIAAALRTSSDTVSPVEFALDRLRLEGIELTTWIPRSVNWSQAVRS